MVSMLLFKARLWAVMVPVLWRARPKLVLLHLRLWGICGVRRLVEVEEDVNYWEIVCLVIGDGCTLGPLGFRKLRCLVFKGLFTGTALGPRSS